MKISLKTYSLLTRAQKNELFDNIEYFISANNFTDYKDKIAVKDILFKIFKDANENHYIRKKALETIGKLTFLNVIRSSATSDLLLDVDLNDNEFILSEVIKYLFYFHIDNETINKLKEFTFHLSGDVSSESYFRLGQLFFFKANDENHIKNLIISNEYFFKSFQEIENRVDAELFYCISEVLINASEKGKYLSKITEIIWQITAFDYDNKVNELYYKIYECISNIDKLQNKEIDRFLDKREFNELCFLHYEILNLEVKNNFENFYLNTFKDNIKIEVLDPFYSQNLLAEKSRIIRILDEDITQEEQVFWKYVIDLIENKTGKKKDTTDIKLIIGRMLPDQSLESLTESLNKMDINDPKVILNFIRPFINHKPFELITGSNVGDDIFKRLVSEIKVLLPNYESQKFLEFQFVLEDIIRYLKRSTEAQKSDLNYQFLFKNNAIENELQRSMLNMFKFGSKRADYYSEETKEFADGGRVDIKYQVNDITLPIEIKRTKIRITVERIKQDYLSQAQTYTYNRDQLGFFVILDLVEKEAIKPMNDLRDLFGIIHLEPQHRVNENHPDYIIWCIVPANKMLPSNRSKYK